MSKAKIVSNKTAANGVGKYVDAVLAGDIIAGPSIRAVCQRHRDDIKRSKNKSYPFKFDAEKAGRMMNFFPDMLILRSGKWDGRQFDLMPWQEFMVGSLGGWVRKDDGRRRFQDVYLQCGKGAGKQLADDTPILTSNRGWTTHGDLKVGDFVFGMDGKPTRVIQVHEPSMPKCYRLEFACGGEIVCSAEHLWKTRVRRAGEKKGGSRYRGRAEFEKVRTAENIYQTRYASKGGRLMANHSVPATPAVDFQHCDNELPVAPYTLGVWLGDGSKTRPVIASHHNDWPFVLDRIMREGYGARMTHEFENHAMYRITGLKQGLKQLGLLIPQTQAKGKTWKRIPEEYLRASPQVRWDLLCGLMDADGSTGAKGVARFSNNNRNLIDGVEWLARSLGFRPNVRKSKQRPHENRPVFVVRFSAHNIGAPFYIPRKRAKIEKFQPKKASYTKWNTVSNIEPVESVKCRCITVAAEDGLYLAGRHLIPTHNSPLCGGLALYLLVADGEAAAEVYLAAATYDQAGIVFGDILKAIESNSDLNECLIVRGGDASPREITYRPPGGSMSLMRRVANNSTGKNISGFRPSAGVFDEVAFWKSPEMLDAMRRGGGKREQPLMLMLTNAGAGIDSVAWPLYQHAYAVAHGETEDDTHFPLIFDIDKTDDIWNDESCWVKANPSYPTLPTPESLRKEVARCKSIPGERNSVRRQHFNEWVSDASQYFLGEESIDAVMVDALDDNKLADLPMAIGLDLSRRDDLTAAAQVWKDADDNYYIRSHFWAPEDGLIERAQAVPRLPWDIWAHDGTINATEGKVVDYRHVVEFLIRMNEEWKFSGIAFDDWRSDMLFKEFQSAGIGLYMADVEGLQRGKPAGKIVLWKHPQGFNRSNPSKKQGAKVYDNGLKSPLWMSESIELLKTGIQKGTLFIERNACMRYNLLSVKVVENDSGGVRFTKSKSTGKIDGCVAAAMGVGLISALPPKSTAPRAMLVG